MFQALSADPQSIKKLRQLTPALAVNYTSFIVGQNNGMTQLFKL